MIVCKFGGSSVASGRQIKKVLSIINNSEDRRIAIVSAPGKRFDEDIKVTDLFIQLYEKVISNKDYNMILNQILRRFKSIEQDLKIKESLIDTFKYQIMYFINTYQHLPLRLLDAQKAVEKILTHN